jgi:hypothetical protein
MSKQTAVEWLEEQISNSSYYQKLIEDIESPLQVQIEGKSKTLKPKSIFQQAKEMEKEQMKEYADYAIKQLHETGICFYDEYGNLEDEKGGDHE